MYTCVQSTKRSGRRQAQLDLCTGSGGHQTACGGPSFAQRTKLELNGCSAEGIGFDSPFEPHSRPKDEAEISPPGGNGETVSSGI